MSLPDYLKSRGFPEETSEGLHFPLRVNCVVCHGQLVGSERVYGVCGHDRKVRRDGDFPSVLTRPGGSRP
jgi:hypothetical protein